MNDKLDEPSNMNNLDHKNKLEKSPKNDHTSNIYNVSKSLVVPVHLTKHELLNKGLYYPFTLNHPMITHDFKR